MVTPSLGDIPPSSPRQAALDLLRLRAGSGKTLWMEVRGRSMFPTLRPDDRVEVEGIDPSRLRLGDIVVLDSGEAGWVIHRFFGWRRVPPIPLTKGDARLFFDPVWAGCRVLGRVRGFQREGRHYSCKRIWLLASALKSAAVWCRAKVSRSLGLGCAA